MRKNEKGLCRNGCGRPSKIAGKCKKCYQNDWNAAKKGKKQSKNKLPKGTTTTPPKIITEVFPELALIAVKTCGTCIFMPVCYLLRQNKGVNVNLVACEKHQGV